MIMVKRWWLQVIVFLFFLWLASTATNGSSLRRDIQSATDQGYFGGLTSAESEELAEYIEKALDAAGMPIEFQINSVISPDRLDVLTFINEPSEFTNLAVLRRGNAAYSPQLDVMFLDVEQIKSAFINDDVDPLVSVSKMFLVMTILHELGHRKLDGGTFGRLNLVTRGADARETRADDFAHKIMAQWTKDNDNPFSDIWGRGAEVAGIFGLISMSMISSRAQTKSEFGSYYTSASHAHLIDRLSNFLDKVMSAQLTNAEITTELQFVANVISAAGNSNSILCELRTQSPIRHISWSDETLWVFSDDYFYKVSLPEIVDSIAQSSYCFKTLEPISDISRPPGTVVAANFKDNDINFVLAEDGRIWKKDSVAWSEVSKLPAELTYFPTTGSVSNPTILRNSSESVTVWHTNLDHIVHLAPQGPKLFFLGNKNAIADGEPALSIDDWVLVAAYSGGFYLAPPRIAGVESGGELQILHINCAVECKIDDVKQFSLDGLPTTSFNIVVTPDGREVYATTSHTVIGTAQEMELYLLQPTSVPVLVTREPLFQKQASEKNLIYYERLYQSVFRWAIATPSGVFVNYVGGDPVLQINKDTGQVLRPYIQSDLFSYNYKKNLLALSDRSTANVKGNAFSVMIIRTHK